MTPRGSPLAHPETMATRMLDASRIPTSHQETMPKRADGRRVKETHIRSETARVVVVVVVHRRRRRRRRRLQPEAYAPDGINAMKVANDKYAGRLMVVPSGRQTHFFDGRLTMLYLQGCTLCRWPSMLRGFLGGPRSCLAWAVGAHLGHSWAPGGILGNC